MCRIFDIKYVYFINMVDIVIEQQKNRNISTAISAIGGIQVWEMLPVELFGHREDDIAKKRGVCKRHTF